jgi:chemotaxis signal transduction protein
MRTMVCFNTDRGRFALPIDATLAVRTIDGMVDLPAPGTDTLGVLPGNPPLPVLSSLGTGGEHIVVVVSNEVRFGLQVRNVVGVRRYRDDQIGPAPKGQAGGLISGTIYDDTELTLVADPEGLAARL